MFSFLKFDNPAFESGLVKPSTLAAGAEFRVDPDQYSLIRSGVSERLGSVVKGLLHSPFDYLRQWRDFVKAGANGAVYKYNTGLAGQGPLAVKINGASLRGFMLNSALGDMTNDEELLLPFNMPRGLLRPSSLGHVRACAPTYYGYLNSGNGTRASSSVTIMSFATGKEEKVEPIANRSERNHLICGALKPHLPEWLPPPSYPDSKGSNILYDRKAGRVTVLDIHD